MDRDVALLVQRRDRTPQVKQLTPTFTSFPLIGKKCWVKLDMKTWLKCRVTVSILDRFGGWILLARSAYWLQHLPLEPVPPAGVSTVARRLSSQIADAR